MTIIKNFNSRNLKDYEHEIKRGGKFVTFQYTISVIFFTFKETSSIYLIKGSESSVFKGLRFTLLTFFLGWWGIPWGPIYTIQSLINNLKGGNDITYEVMDSIRKELDPRTQYFG